MLNPTGRITSTRHLLSYEEPHLFPPEQCLDSGRVEVEALEGYLTLPVHKFRMKIQLRIEGDSSKDGMHSLTA